jgi:hypothetical protein
LTQQTKIERLINPNKLQATKLLNSTMTQTSNACESFARTVLMLPSLLQQTSNTSIEIFGKLPDDVQRYIFEFLPETIDKELIRDFPRSIRLRKAITKERLMKFTIDELEIIYEKRGMARDYKQKKSEYVDYLIKDNEDVLSKLEKYDKEAWYRIDRFESRRQSKPVYPYRQWGLLEVNESLCLFNNIVWVDMVKKEEKDKRKITKKINKQIKC